MLVHGGYHASVCTDTAVVTDVESPTGQLPLLPNVPHLRLEPRQVRSSTRSVFGEITVQAAVAVPTAQRACCSLSSASPISEHTYQAAPPCPKRVPRRVGEALKEAHVMFCPLHYPQTVV